MPHLEFIWISGPDGNIEHLAEHDVSTDEAEYVILNPIATEISRTTGRPARTRYEVVRRFQRFYQDRRAAGCQQRAVSLLTT